MRLIHRQSGKSAKVGDKVTDPEDGDSGTIEYFAKPHKAASEGKVVVWGREFYVSVFDLEWIEREDQGFVPLAQVLEASGKTISAEHVATLGAWTGADWTHDLEIDNGPKLDAGGEPMRCTGKTSACEMCDRAQVAAASAAHCATEAVGYWECGEPLLALIAAREAAALEQTFGDDPVYGPLRSAVEAAIVEASEASEAWSEQHAEAVASV